MRSVIALMIVAAVVARYLSADVSTLEESLKSAFMIAVGYYLGSSKGSTDKTAAATTTPTKDTSHGV
jgi:hypothetical protein